ncbi:MAG TPA: NAD(P)/FAD-dependent oxidoreductase [Acidimicrobiales bacterium]|nr:NAD(P)/FAD-dependent oxidoreductase [Acidimicrobiales bacterium]
MTLAGGVEGFDVVVVGGRCAGSPLAAHLARSGLEVCVVDRAEFPSDTISTHLFQVEGVAVLERLGVVERLRATGAPWIETVSMRVEDVSVRQRLPRRPADAGPALCVRRPLLDTVLVERARESGAQVRTSMRVTGLVEHGGRVCGVKALSGAGRQVELRARLVVGADGRASTLARLVGARSYHVVANQRFGYWAYFEGARRESPAAVTFERWDDELVIGAPTDSGLYIAMTLPPLERLASFTADLESSFDAHLAASPLVSAILDGARRTGRPRGTAGYPGFFRESAGPGWVLVGDAGHFKDPTPGQGISDALRQGETLAEAIVQGLGGARPLDAALAHWWRWRDDDAFEMHWFCSDMGAAGPVPRPFLEMVRDFASRPEGLDAWFEILSHRLEPSEVLTPARLLAATARLLGRGSDPRAAVMGEAWRLAANDVRRKWLRKRPRMTPAADLA